MSAAPFSDRWDSGTIGYAVTDKATFLKNYFGEKASVLTKRRRAHALVVLSAELKEYNAYLSGDVWGYVVYDDNGNEVDSCWGFCGREVLDAVLQQLEEDIKDAEN